MRDTGQVVQGYSDMSPADRKNVDSGAAFLIGLAILVAWIIWRSSRGGQ